MPPGKVQARMSAEPQETLEVPQVDIIYQEVHVREQKHSPLPLVMLVHMYTLGSLGELCKLSCLSEAVSSFGKSLIEFDWRGRGTGVLWWASQGHFRDLQEKCFGLPVSKAPGTHRKAASQPHSGFCRPPACH